MERKDGLKGISIINRQNVKLKKKGCILLNELEKINF
jgi:hypothetical protein